MTGHTGDWESGKRRCAGRAAIRVTRLFMPPVTAASVRGAGVHLITRCYDGTKTCPFFAWDLASVGTPKPLALCGAPEHGSTLWIPRDPVRVDPPETCPLRAGSITVTGVEMAQTRGRKGRTSPAPAP